MIYRNFFLGWWTALLLPLVGLGASERLVPGQPPKGLDCLTGLPQESEDGLDQGSDESTCYNTRNGQVFFERPRVTVTG